MNCRKSESLFSAFLEDELSQEERRALESHLLACRRCADAAQELRAVVTAVQSLPAVPAGEYFEEDLMARIRSGEGLRPSVIEWLHTHARAASLRPLFLAGAGACAVWIAVLLVGPHGTGTAPEGPLADRGTRRAPAAETPAPMIAASEETKSDSAPASERATPAHPGRSDPVTSSRVLAASGPQAKRGGSAPRTAVPAAGTVTTWAEGDLIPLFGLDDTTRLGRDPNYLDEYILDQFYMKRGSAGSNAPIVPVSGSPSDDVYVTF